MLSCLCRIPSGVTFSSTRLSLFTSFSSVLSFVLPPSLSDAISVLSGSSSVLLSGCEQVGRFSSTIATDRICLLSSLARPSSSETFAVNVAVEQVAAIFLAQTMQSMACSRSHWLASSSTWGKLLKKYLLNLLFIASLCASPKSIACWQVMYILVGQWNPVPSSTSRRGK